MEGTHPAIDLDFPKCGPCERMWAIARYTNKKILGCPYALDTGVATTSLSIVVEANSSRAYSSDNFYPGTSHGSTQMPCGFVMALHGATIMIAMIAMIALA